MSLCIIIISFDLFLSHPEDSFVFLLLSDPGGYWVLLLGVHIAGRVNELSLMVLQSSSPERCFGVDLYMSFMIPPHIEWFEVSISSDHPRIVQISFSISLAPLSTCWGFAVEDIGDHLFHWQLEFLCFGELYVLDKPGVLGPHGGSRSRREWFYSKTSSILSSSTRGTSSLVNFCFVLSIILILIDYRLLSWMRLLSCSFSDVKYRGNWGVWFINHWSFFQHCLWSFLDCQSLWLAPFLRECPIGTFLCPQCKHFFLYSWYFCCFCCWVRVGRGFHL